jgi:hypothetical protein
MEKGHSIPLLGSQRPGCHTNADSTILTWGRGKFVKTIPLHPSKNVAIMNTKAGIKKYSAFVIKIEDLEPKICCLVATGSPEPSVAEVTDDETEDDVSSVESTTTTQTGKSKENDLPTQVNFQDQPNMRGVSLERDKPLDNDKDELY